MTATTWSPRCWSTTPTTSPGTRCAGRSCPGSAAGWSAGWPGSTRSPASSTWITWPRWSTRAPSWCAALARRTSSAPRSRSPTVRALADGSGYAQPNGERRSYLLVDGAQLVPGSFVDVQALDVDYLAFSFHKMLAPFGVGVLYGKQHLLQASLPFLYGGDMIAEGRVFPDRVEYNALPWKYAAGHAQHPGRDRLRPGAAAAAGPGADPRPPRLLRHRPARRARRGPGRHEPGVAVELPADRPGAGRAGRDPGDHDLRAGRRGAAHLAGRVQPGRPRPGQRGRRPEPGRGRIPRGLPLRHARPPRPRPGPARELPAELLPLQHPRRGRPGRGRGGRHRRRPTSRRPRAPWYRFWSRPRRGGRRAQVPIPARSS